MQEFAYYALFGSPLLWLWPTSSSTTSSSG
jgi:hypothetical protein